jgi:hypothetical protein
MANKIPLVTGATTPEAQLQAADTLADANGNAYLLAAALVNMIVTGTFATTAIEDTITAHAGGTQAAAFGLGTLKVIHHITVCATAGDSVALPTAVLGQYHYVHNSGVASCQVYGRGTDTINDIATATGISLPPATGALFITVVVAGASKWYAFGLPTTTLTGDVTGSGAGSFATTIAAAAVTYAKIQNVSATSRFLGRITAGAGSPEELTAANAKTILALVSSDVGLGNVTNDAQTKAAIAPNTAPAAGQILVGNAGGTAYAPVTVSGSGATITAASTGVVTISGIANASLTTGPTGNIVGTSDTQTLTNKRIDKRIETLADAATVTMNWDNADGGALATISQATQFLNPTNVAAVNMRPYLLRIISTTARALSWDTKFRSGASTTLPATTTANKSLYMLFVYQSTADKYDIQYAGDGY